MTLNYFKSILSFIFPPSENEDLIYQTTKEDILTLYEPRDGIHATTLLPYTDKRVRAAIHLVKFRNHTYAKKLLANVLAKHLQSLPAISEAVIIPIPLSKARLRKRGYNQVQEVIQEALTAISSTPSLCTKQLQRIRDTSPQTALSKNKRLQNVQGAFAVKDKKYKLQNKHIILIDDVITTGATLSEAKQALKRAHPSSITCIALAH